MTTATINNASAAFDAVRRQGDTGPAILATLLDDAGVVVNLTGSTVTLYSRNQSTKAPITTAGVCTLPNATLGQVSYALQTADTLASGIVEFEFKVQFPTSGPLESFPNGKFLIMNVVSSI